ncbi:DUF6950 family protein [Paracraurococcus ruber]|uniref:DUF6950 domain-containing protein n=1 Tax=Paracraurococcus ruber TaxID=77675 RepID=A0ABS1CR61_9PROT|nr:hypothetical protein [Paracraurococcus ruber]MBK1656840.1 hypothetical protein [Paracraurococcus ruber]TDG33955.1 hypothetical protein E2C05_01560 [Paracraurococcus ruber]
MRLPPTRARLPDWPERLADLLDARRDQPFWYGGQDCGSFAGDVALALTGEDPIAWLRGAYGSEAELDAILRDLGGFEAAAERTMAEFGSPEIPPAFAQRGDWALVEAGNMLLLGVVVDHRVAVTGLDGLRYVPLRMARRTWAI